jgi:hypothetical protein
VQLEVVSDGQSQVPNPEHILPPLTPTWMGSFSYQFDECRVKTSLLFEPVSRSRLKMRMLSSLQGDRLFGKELKYMSDARSASQDVRRFVERGVSFLLSIEELGKTIHAMIPGMSTLMSSETSSFSLVMFLPCN